MYSSRDMETLVSPLSNVLSLFLELFHPIPVLTFPESTTKLDKAGVRLGYQVIRQRIIKS